MNPSGRALALASMCSFLSGASALVYEIVWTRELGLTVGTTTAAVSVVLAAFMSGLALGAASLGRVADRTSDPLKLFARLQAGVGLYALGLPVLISIGTPAYVSLARAAAAGPLLLLLRFGIGFLLLAPPTVLMGGALPALLRFSASRHAGLGLHLSTLYTFNLAGAVVGSVATGFVLIRILGVRGATLVAVVTNLAVAATGMLWSAASRAASCAARPRPSALTDSESSHPTLTTGARRLVWAVVFFSGLLAMGYEVVWTRILIFSVGSTVYSFSIILATVLVGLALGSALLAALAERAHPMRILAGAELLAGVTALALVPLFGRVPPIVEALSQHLGYSSTARIAATVAHCLLLTLIPATLMGVVFPLGMRLLVDDLRRAGRAVGAAYTVNALGSIVGSVAIGFLVIPLLSLKGTLLLLAAVQVVLGWLLLARCDLSPPGRRRVLMASAVLIGGAFGGASGLLRGPNPFDAPERVVQGSPDAIEAHHDGVGASVSVARYADGSRSLRIDGFEAAADDARGGYMPLMAHIPLLLHPDPRRFLVICFGTGTTAGTGLLYPGLGVEGVDINPSVFEFAGYFERVNRGVARDPRARLVVDDGRNFLMTTRGLYDVISSEPMPPTLATVVNLYTREYYQLAHERLRPGGLLVQWLPFHLLTVDEALGILRTVQEVFPETSLWIHSSTGIIVARRDAPVQIDLLALGRRLDSQELRMDLERLQVIGPEGLADRYMLGAREIRLLTAGIALITDDRPSLEFHSPRYVTLASLRQDRARSLEMVYRLRARASLPLQNASAAERVAFESRREVCTHRLLAELWLTMGRTSDARRELSEALARARSCSDQQKRALLDVIRVGPVDAILGLLGTCLRY